MGEIMICSSSNLFQWNQKHVRILTRQRIHHDPCLKKYKNYEVNPSSESTNVTELHRVSGFALMDCVAGFGPNFRDDTI